MRTCEFIEKKKLNKATLNEYTIQDLCDDTWNLDTSFFFGSSLK